MAINIGLKARDFEKAKPKEIKGDKLGSALKACEKALADEKRKKDDPDAIGGGLQAVEQVEAAVQETIKKECDAKKHKDLIAGLKKLEATCAAEIKRLKEALDKAGGDVDDDGEVSDEEMLGEKLFKLCLKKAKTKSSALDGVSFCVGVTKKAEDCKLVMVKKKNFAKQTFRRFLKICKENKDLGLEKKRLTYGAAYRDPTDSATLVLQLADGANTAIPGMVRKLDKWLLKNKQEMTPFKKLLIVDPAGNPVVSPPDPEDGEDSQNVSDAEQGQQAEAPQQAAGAPAAGAAAAGAAAGENQTAAPSEPAAAATQEAAPVDAGAGPQDENEIEDLRKELKKCRREWQQTKEQCIRSIEAVKDGIRDYYLDDPEQFKIATSKLSQLDAIMDNLSDDLRDCLDKYVSTPKSRPGDLEAHRTRAVELVSNFLSYANRDPLLKAIDEEDELADPNLKVKEPIERSLKNLLKTLR